MTVHHLPEYGISTTTAGDNNVMVNATEEDDLNDVTNQSSRSSNGSKKRSIDNISTTHSSLPPNQSTITNNTTTNTFNMPQISASNYKSKKDIAINSLYTPTKHEIYGHIKYLSEEGMKLVMKEIDNCVSYTLKYSSKSTSNDNNGIKLEKGISSSSKFMRSSNDLMTLASEINNYFDMFQPEEENEELQDVTIDESMNNMKETQPSNNIQRQDILNDMLPNKYDPTLLPLVSIKCYPNVLDRIEITKGLVSDLSKKKKKKRNIHKNSSQQDDHIEKSPCVCILRSTSELVQQGHLITEILSQCISNDTQNGEAFAMELQKQRKRFKSQTHGGINRGVLIKSIWSWTQSLIEWAKYTTTFNSIVIVLEDAEKIPSPTLDSFFTTLAALRSNDGVPISVIVVDVTPGGLGDRLSMLRSPSLRGTSGVMTRELLVPLPQTQLGMSILCVYTCQLCFDTLLTHLCLMTIRSVREQALLRKVSTNLSLE